MNEDRLPAGFESLQGFVRQWAVPTTRERDVRRSHSRTEEREAFFSAASPLLEPALALLDGKSFDTMSEEETRLLHLVLSFAHVAMAVEIHGRDEPRHARLRSSMEITRSPADAVENKGQGSATL